MVVPIPPFGELPGAAPMPPMGGGVPPQPPPRTPYDVSTLPPDVQAELQAGRPVNLPDGMTVYPDGSAAPSGGGTNAPPLDGGMAPPLPPINLTGGPAGPAAAPVAPPWQPGQGTSPLDPTGVPRAGTPFEGPQFDPYFRNAAVGMPGQQPMPKMDPVEEMMAGASVAPPLNAISETPTLVGQGPTVDPGIVEERAAAQNGEQNMGSAAPITSLRDRRARGR